jgi:predicted MPP superfamily phosphohydrolase
VKPRLHGRWLLAFAGLVLVGACHGFVVEPHFVLARDEVKAPLVGQPFRVVHLSDLHVASESRLLRRLARLVLEAEPDLVLVSGDFIAGTQDPEVRRAYAETAARLIGKLAMEAPVMAVQGHADYHGDVVGILAEAGVEWLSNEGRRIGPGGSILLLGLNQQVGHDALVELEEEPFAALAIDDLPVGGWRQPGRAVNRYLSFDPSPAHLADTGGPMAWSGYEVTGEVWIERPGDGGGIAAHARYALGEHRSIRLRLGPDRTFALAFDGSGPVTGDLDTGVTPQAGRWYRLRLRTEVTAEGVRALGRAWPAGQEEPGKWQAWGLDGTAIRVGSGTVALWGSGLGKVAFRHLTVTGADGRPLLEESFTQGLPPGWRNGTRGTRLQLAFSRSPRAPEETSLLVLTHDPASAREAQRLGAALVLAGHTHGGQVRLPGFGALTTRSALGRRYDRGLFTLDSSAADDASTLLFVNAGVGTSFIPVRFFSPPTYAVVDLGP